MYFYIVELVDKKFIACLQRAFYPKWNALKENFGFTLIELMVVIGIVAILSTVGLVLYTGVQKTSRDAKRMGDIKEIQKALEQYYAINNDYVPVNVQNGNASVNSVSALNSYFQNNIPPSEPNLGVVNYEYKYYTCGGPSPAKVTTYIVCAKLENPSGKANMDAVPVDGCGNLSSSGSTYYCIKGLSN